ncbi:MAG: ABC transporter substrate-binding protein [Pseudomonadota bacterium]
MRFRRLQKFETMMRSVAGRFLIGTLIAVAATTAVTPAACGAPQYGGALRSAFEIRAMGFDAIKTRMLYSAGRATAMLVMEKLFERGEDDTLIPVLGLSATASTDGTVWTIALRRGVFFHDGTPLTADAVVAHWRRLLDPKNRFSERILLTPITAVEKVDDHTVRFVLAHAWLPFTGVLTDPASFTSLIPSPTAVANDTQNRHPVGTGPFIFKEWKPGDQITVTKNPDYWQKGRPYLDAVELRIITDHESRYAALVSGQVDVMVTDRPAHVIKLRENKNFTCHPLKFRGAVVLVFNTTKPPLDDVRVRRALAHGWDQKKYIAASFKDIVPYVEDWYGDAVDCGDVGYLAPDPDKARALLAEYGQPVTLEYLHSATNRGREAGIILQQMMKDIGVTVTPVPADFSGIVKRMFSKQFDISSWVVRGGYDMGPMTEAWLNSKSPWNMSRYSNEAVDALLEKQQSSTDLRERAEALCTVARKVNADAPFLYLFGRTYYMIIRNTVQGGVALPVLGEEGVRLTDAWIKQ